MISAILGLVALIIAIPLWLLVFAAIKKIFSFLLSPKRHIDSLKLNFDTSKVKPFTYIWTLGLVIAVIFLIYGLGYKNLKEHDHKSNQQNDGKKVKSKILKEMESYRKRKRKYKNSNPISPSPLLQF